MLVAREAEVCHLHVELLVEQNVFELEVAMDDVALVHIAQNIYKLVHEVASAVFAHGTGLIAEVIEEAAGDVLEQDVDQVFDDAT